MKIEKLEKLDAKVFDNYSGRKIAGRISVFVNLRDNSIIGVPVYIEHIEFAPHILPESDYALLIPSHIDTKINPESEQEEVTGVITGVCGLEISLGVTHRRKDLRKAHFRVWDFIKKGTLPIASNRDENKVVYRYST